MNYFLIDETGIVQNAIMWDGDTENNPYPTPAGWLLVPSNVGGLGWTYANGVFSPPTE